MSRPSRRLRPRHAPPERVELPSVEGRPPPHDLAAEAAVLSAAMNAEAALGTALETLKPEHFYSEAHARIWQACQALASLREPVDLVSVRGWLLDRDWLEKVGGSPYLAQIVDATPAVAHVGAHAKIVFGKWQRRQVIATAHRIAAEGYGDVGSDAEYAKEAAEALDALAHEGAKKKQLTGLKEPLQRAFASLTAAAERGDRILGIPTGYDRLDGKIAGLNDGDLTIVAARPGMGKTSFVLNIAINVASPRAVNVPGKGQQEVPGFGVCVFSLEMPEEQNAIRMAASEGRVDLGRLRGGTLQPDDWRRLTDASQYLVTLPIWVDDTPGVSVQEIRSKVRRQQAVFDREATDTAPARRVGLVIVDYLQLMRGDGESREQVIAGISRGLKDLAKELKVPVIALSQLNRSVETRTTKDKRPQLSDLRESGAIEQDADTIIFIYRDDYYNPETSDLRGIAELIIAKQRNGPTGKVKVRFAASCTRFDNLEPGDYPDDKDE